MIEPGRPAGYLLDAVGELLFVKLWVFDIREARSICRLAMEAAAWAREQFLFNLSLRSASPHGPTAHGYNAGARAGATNSMEDAPGNSIERGGTDAGE